MENNSVETGEIVYPTPRRQTLGKFVENFILPKNQRNVQRTNVPDVTFPEAEADSKKPPLLQKKYLPVFMVLVMYDSDIPYMTRILGYNPHRRHERYEMWRFITVLLVHTGHVHLWTNILFQLILGGLLEIIHHWPRIAIIYFSSILGGSLFIKMFSPYQYVGACAGVYGLIFSHLSTIMLNWNEMDRKCCRLFPISLYLIFDIGYSLFLQMTVVTSYEANLNISVEGRLGGGLTGFLVSILVLRNFGKHPWEEKTQRICFVVLITLCAIMILIRIT